MFRLCQYHFAQVQNFERGDGHGGNDVRRGAGIVVGVHGQPKPPQRHPHFLPPPFLIGGAGQVGGTAADNALQHAVAPPLLSIQQEQMQYKISGTGSIGSVGMIQQERAQLDISSQ